MPSSTESLIQQALAIHEAGDLKGALSLYHQALKVDPKDFNALHLIGVIHLQEDDLTEAESSFLLAFELNSEDANLCNNLCVLYEKSKRFDKALTFSDACLRLDPKNPQWHYNRANLLDEMGCYDLAIQSFTLAIELDSQYAQAYLNRGLTHKKLNQLQEALADYTQALEVDPNQTQAFLNLGVVYLEMRELEFAGFCFANALKIDPNFVEAQWNQSLLYLLQGEYSKGWPLYESRWSNPNCSSFKRKRNFTQPLWLGQMPLQGKTILLHAEQGFGDTIQFIRYAPKVHELTLNTVVEVHKSLVDLFAHSMPSIQFVAKGSKLPDFDMQTPLMSLPLAFQTTLKTIPNTHPYLHADPNLAIHWSDRMSKDRTLKIGLVWSGGVREDQPILWDINQRRNISLEHFKVLNLPGTTFYSLQKGEQAQNELQTLNNQSWGGPQILDWTQELSSFAQTAALIENLDLVISVDTAVAHLAAALGKPVWILNRLDGCWRWLNQQTSSPWYPSVRLFNQTRTGDWDVVMKEIQTELLLKLKS